ncbi:MAG: hypothetical protein M3Z23_06480 [Acidobacteriota bacterium]|nr:hypothetical protein [Acidobacteriota bacterium]
MARMLTITLDDRIYQDLLKKASESGRTLEPAVITPVIAGLKQIDDDPLLRLAGCIKPGYADIGERHDDYIERLFSKN